jgi:hypothetical protein
VSDNQEEMGKSLGIRPKRRLSGARCAVFGMRSKEKSRLTLGGFRATFHDPGIEGSMQRVIGLEKISRKKLSTNRLGFSFGHFSFSVVFFLCLTR